MRRTSLISTCVAGAAALCAGPALAAPAQAAAPAARPAAHQDWVSTGTGMTSGVSGMVVTGRHGERIRALVVRDNKKPGENRLARIEYVPGKKAHVEPLDWRGDDLPVDLEAIDRVPGHPGSYVAVASAGTGYRIDVEGRTARVRDTFTLPGLGEDDNVENFALSARDGKLVAVWADRGQDSRPATVYAARASFTGDDTGFGTVTRRTLRTPYPRTHVRHASDLKITESGRLLVSAASDPGDDGPFASAVLDAGRVRAGADGTVSLHIAGSPRVLGTFEGHKVEALSCLPHSRWGVLGTDDENAGGALRTARFCTR
ncbi:hypothetical protein ACF06W_03910 [Streptomyces albus]|uniref:hypothetical protein n=1 Tax=Streptomyces albus TaxID=1888 RepID=UPI0036FAE804